MAHLWHETDRRWRPLPLEGSTVRVAALISPGDADANEAGSDGDVLLTRSGPNGDRWSLMAPVGASVRVNGQSVTLGVRVLHDRDELVLGSESGAPVHAFFSTEKLAEVVTFAGDGKPMVCPRCKQAIKPEMPAVRCPDCGAWHHQIGAGHPEHAPRECWTYAERCALCPQPTELGAGYRWTPDSL